MIHHSLSKAISLRGAAVELKLQFDYFFDNKFNSAVMTEFENWFSTMAAYVYKTDFEQIKPSGSKGDKKCDGHRISTETIYQCYAPESSKTFGLNAKNKIADSFPDVVTLWPKMKMWIFIHNNAAGLPVPANDKLEELRVTYPNINFSAVSREFLKSELHDKLRITELFDVYPEAAKNIKEPRMESIRPLLKRIIAEKKDELGNDAPFGEIPNKAKIEFNNLSAASKGVINRGRVHAGVVKDYLNNMSMPENVTKIQETLRQKYLELVDYGYEPDDVLSRIIDSLQIEHTMDEYAACGVIVAYFFDTCDIFENPREKPC